MTRTEDRPCLLSGRRALALCMSVLMSLLSWHRVWAERGLWLGLLSASVVASVGYFLAERRRVTAGEPWGARWAPRREHGAQVLALALIYGGWCVSWTPALSQLPLLIAQLAFAYLIEMSVKWYRAPVCSLGLEPLTLVLSVNLFFFFKDEFFYLQCVIIALAVLSQAQLRWRHSGDAHQIFNPSGLSLGITLSALIMSDSMSWTWAEEIARSHARGGWSYELIFGSGLIIAWRFRLELTLICAGLVTLGLGALYFEQTGAYRFVDSALPVSIFLGMNSVLLDPNVAPRAWPGRAILGALFGLGVFLLDGYLRGLKLLSVEGGFGFSVAFASALLTLPLLNLVTPLIDHATEGLSEWSARLVRPGKAVTLARVALMSGWVITFVGFMRPQLREHPGRALQAWLKACDQTPAPQRGRFACVHRDRIYQRQCDRGDLSACHNLALSWERGEGGEVDLQTSRALYRRACDGGELLSCHHLGGLYVREANQSDDDSWLKQATSLLGRACEGGVWGACSRLASLMLSEWGQPEQRGEAWGLWERACEHREPFACFELAQRALIPLTTRQARCQEGDALMCLSAERSARLSGQSLPLSQARDELLIACQGELWVACANVAWMLWRGDGGARDPERALKLMQRSCVGGLSDACERARSMSRRARPALPPAQLSP